MTGRALFIVLLRLLGLLIVISNLLGLVQTLSMALERWGNFVYLGVGVHLVLVALGVFCVRAGDRIAGWCGWSRAAGAEAGVSDTTPADWTNAGQTVVAWLAIVWAVAPLSVLLAGLFRVDSRGFRVEFWGYREQFLHVVILLAIAIWLLRRARRSGTQVA